MLEEVTFFLRVLSFLGIVIFGLRSIWALMKKNNQTKLFFLLAIFCLIINISLNASSVLDTVLTVIGLTGSIGFIYFSFCGIVSFYKKNGKSKKYLILVILSIFIMTSVQRISDYYAN